MSVSEWTEGLKKERRFSLYRQPLSHDLRRASSPAGEPFGALYKLPHNQNHQLNWWYAQALKGHITGERLKAH